MKKKLEAVMFSSGKYLAVEDIAKLCRSDVDSVKNALNELKEEYEAKDSSLTLINEGDKWKLTVKEKFIPLVRKIVAETELTKAVMQTLAYVAYKAPILQSDVVSVRSNKAYDHIAELESKGFVTKTKHGHTFLIKLTQKFFEYFDLKSEKDVKERFKGVSEISAEEVLLKDVEKKWEMAKPRLEVYGEPELEIYGKRTEGEEIKEEEGEKKVGEEEKEKEIEEEKLERKEGKEGKREERVKKEEKEEREEKKLEKKKKREKERKGEKKEEKEESQFDELKKEQKEKVVQKEVKKIEEHFNNVEKKETKKEVKSKIKNKQKQQQT